MNNVPQMKIWTGGMSRIFYGRIKMEWLSGGPEQLYTQVMLQTARLRTYIKQVTSQKALPWKLLYGKWCVNGLHLESKDEGLTTRFLLSFPKLSNEKEEWNSKRMQSSINWHSFQAKSRREQASSLDWLPGSDELLLGHP
jgi:hypothetical protein